MMESIDRLLRSRRWLFLNPMSTVMEIEGKEYHVSVTNQSTIKYMDPVSLLRAYFLLCSLAIIIVRLVPPLRSRFLDYGARGHQPAPTTHNEGSIGQFLDYCASFTVPHSFFSSFYLLSITCSTMWLASILMGSGVFDILHKYLPILMQTSANKKFPTSPARIGLSFLLMLLQAHRRHYECKYINSQPSTSRMSILHYILGQGFYVLINLGLVVEHLPLLVNLESPWSILFAVNSPSNPLQTLSLLLFAYASYSQHKSHRYLASLPKYTLPTQFPFNYIIAPHYTAECLTYLSLSIISAPAGYVLNGTIFSAFVFVVVNLGITAEGTKSWMLGKFREDEKQINSRWKMIPGIW